jgi:hypothetical protein
MYGNAESMKLRSKFVAIVLVMWIAVLPSFGAVTCSDMKTPYPTHENCAMAMHGAVQGQQLQVASAPHNCCQIGSGTPARQESAKAQSARTTAAKSAVARLGADAPRQIESRCVSGNPASPPHPQAVLCTFLI